MMLITRFYLVILLVLLQLAAPMIHAHTNVNSEIGTSFHLPQFEQINTLLQEGSSFIAPHVQDGEMVTVSAGIKQEQRRFLLSNDNVNAAIVLSLLISALLQYISCCFLIKKEPVKTFPFFYLAAPRASPFFPRSLFAG